MTISDLLVTQIGTHPMLTASPAGYPLIKAAEIIARKLQDSGSERLPGILAL